MGKKHHPSGMELLQIKAREHAYLVAAQKTTMIISMFILHYKYKWDAEQLNGWVDAYEDVLEYYSESKEYNGLLKEWNDYFRDYAGIDILMKKR